MRTIVITGAGSGIGRATALACAQRGDWIAALDKNGETAEETAVACIRLGTKAIAIPCDVGKEDEVCKAFGRSAGELGSAWGILPTPELTRAEAFTTSPSRSGPVSLERT